MSRSSFLTQQFDPGLWSEEFFLPKIGWSASRNLPEAKDERDEWRERELGKAMLAARIIDYIYIYIYIYIFWFHGVESWKVDFSTLLQSVYIAQVNFPTLEPDIGLAVRVFASGPGDLGSLPGRVIPKTQKMVLDASLLNTQHYEYGSRVK